MISSGHTPVTILRIVANVATDGTWSQAGTSSEGGCTGCNAGQFMDDEDNECQQCPQGKISSENSVVCALCSAGYYSNSDGTACEPCPGKLQVVVLVHTGKLKCMRFSIWAFVLFCGRWNMEWGWLIGGWM